MTDFPAELNGELHIVQLKFMHEFEARFPGYGKIRAVWR